MATGICMRCVLLIECQHISVVRILSYSTSANCLQLNSLVIDQLFMKQAQERERSLERASEKFVLTISARLFLLFDAKTETEKGTYYNMIVHTAKKSWCNVNLHVRIHRMIQGKKKHVKKCCNRKWKCHVNGSRGGNNHSSLAKSRNLLFAFCTQSFSWKVHVVSEYWHCHCSGYSDSIFSMSIVHCSLFLPNWTKKYVTDVVHWEKAMVCDGSQYQFCVWALHVVFIWGLSVLYNVETSEF